MVLKSLFGRAEEGNPDLTGRDRPADSGWLVAGDGELTASAAANRRQATNRRGGVWWTLLYGNFHPRRRNSRRTVDQHEYWFDWHEPRVLYLALGVFLLSCTDALFTLNLLHAGAAEANIVMASMLETSMDRFVIAKISITGFCLCVLVFAARRKVVRSFSVEHLLQTFFVGYLMLICYEIYMFWYVFELSISPIRPIIWSQLK